MDPYDYARQQGQVMGQPDPGPDDDYEPEDLMDLLLHAFATAGHMDDMPAESRQAIAVFAQFANDHLGTHRVASTGVVDGGFALVFEDGRAVPMASVEAAPERPDPTIPITTPKDSRMRGMKVDTTAVQITTGNPQHRRRT
jgi:hypothetical protein